MDKGDRLPNKRHVDFRPESRVINFKVKNPFKVIGRVKGIRNRFNIIKNLIKPSQEYIKKQRNPRMTIGIIQPEILKIYIKKSEQKVKRLKHPEISSILEYISPRYKEDAQKRREVEKKLRQYAVRILDIHFRFKCINNPNCLGHNKQVLDDGLHQYIRKLNRVHPIDKVIEKTKELIENAHSKSWVFLGLGTLNAYPFLKYTIGSVFRFPKSVISPLEISNIFTTKQTSVRQFL